MFTFWTSLALNPPYKGRRCFLASNTNSVGVHRYPGANYTTEITLNKIMPFLWFIIITASIAFN